MTAHRRQVLKGIGAVPIAAAGTGTLGSILSDSAAAATKHGPGKLPDMFAELGIEPIINAGGTMTYLSGNLMLPEVLDAVQATSRDFVNMYELQDAVGDRIARMLRTEGAMVTSGAASALAIGTAAVLTGQDDEKIKALPFLEGGRPEVVIQKSHRYVFDQNIKMAGIQFVEVDGPSEMEQAINENTAMAHFFNAASDWYGTPDSITHEQFVSIAKNRNIPTFIDAAADVPPVERLFMYQEMGFDLVTFSGGKILRGPQSAGLLFGRRDLIEAAKKNFSPEEAPIGRAMKVNKEEIFGMYAALKYFLNQDHEAQWREWMSRARKIKTQVERVPTVEATINVPKGPSNQFPGLRVTWDQSRVKITPQQAGTKLLTGSPRIQVGGGGDTELRLAVVTLRDDQVGVVGRTVRKLLEDAQ